MTNITKKIIQIKDFRDTRNPINNEDFMLTISTNLIENLSDRNNFIHKELKYYKENNKTVDKNLKIITGMYICSLITCWETFFRDLYIFLCDSDEDINARLQEVQTQEIPLNLTLGEFNARKYNFQNLKQIKDALDNIFQRETVSLSDYFTTEIFEGVLNKNYSLIYNWIQNGSIKEKIDNTLEKGFEIRHKVTHDANFLIDFDSTLLSEIECVFQTVPQFLTSSIAEKYSQKRLVFNVKENYVRITNTPTENEKNYVFNTEDFMAEDYKIIE